ncbi:MAG: hypothetical protein ABJA16_14095, partial [Nakamurella sp.]
MTSGIEASSFDVGLDACERCSIAASPTARMILVDTPIWIGHLHRFEATSAALLVSSEVCGNPMIIGELALGFLAR